MAIPDSVRSTSFNVKCSEAVMQVDMFGERLLRLQTPKIMVRIDAGELVAELSPVVVDCSSNPSVASDLLLRTSLEPGSHITLKHGFTNNDKQSMPPWCGAVEILLEDPDFSSHRELLLSLCAGFDAEPGFKRSLEDAESNAESSKKPRL